MASQFHCPLCQGMFQIDPGMAGGKVRCPHCSGVVQLPGDPPTETTDAPTIRTGRSKKKIQFPAVGETTFSIAPTAPTSPPSYPASPPSTPSLPAAPSQALACPTCQGMFQLPPELAATQVACPHCQSIVAVPGGALGAIPSPSAAPPMSAPAPSSSSPPATAPSTTAPPTSAPPPPPAPTLAPPTSPPASAPPTTAPPASAPLATSPNLPASSVQQSSEVKPVPTSAPSAPTPSSGASNESFPSGTSGAASSSPNSEADSPRPSPAESTPPTKAAPAVNEPSDRSSVASDSIGSDGSAEAPDVDATPESSDKRAEAATSTAPKTHADAPVEGASQNSREPEAISDPEFSEAGVPSEANPDGTSGILDSHVDEDAGADAPPAAHNGPGADADRESIAPSETTTLKSGEGVVDDGRTVGQNAAPDTLDDDWLPPPAIGESDGDAAMNDESRDGDSIPTPGEQVALPTGAALAAAINEGGAEKALVTEDGELVTLHDPVKTLHIGDEEIELHQLSPEERAARRFRKNLIVWTIGVLILVATMYFMR